MTRGKNLLFVLLLLPFIALAEYNGHQIKFSMECHDGSEIIGYNYLALIYREDQSISYETFLESNYEHVLRNQFNDSVGAFSYFQNRIKYDYEDYNGEQRFIYTLTDKKAIDLNNIKTFTILELTDQTYDIGISTQHEWHDRIWMQTKPTEKYAFGGNLCSYDIYIHEKNTKTDNIIKALKQVMHDAEKEIKEQQDIMDRSDGKDYYEAEEKIDRIQAEIDHKLSEELQNFNGMKVVIITMCSC